MDDQRMHIRQARPTDAESIAKIYNYYIANSVVTFETSNVSSEQINQRIIAVLEKKLPWIVAEDPKGTIIGYAYATPWKDRAAYRYSVESTIYISSNFLGCGIGSQLLSQLIEDLKQTDVHAIISGITLPNSASVAIHEKFGMQQVAHFKQVGFKFDQWLDVGYWQKIIK